VRLDLGDTHRREARGDAELPQRSEVDLDRVGPGRLVEVEDSSTRFFFAQRRICSSVGWQVAALREVPPMSFRQVCGLPVGERSAPCAKSSFARS
jgi:hypothetical protein